MAETEIRTMSSNLQWDESCSTACIREDTWIQLHQESWQILSSVQRYRNDSINGGKMHLHIPSSIHRHIRRRMAGSNDIYIYFFFQNKAGPALLGHLYFKMHMDALPTISFGILSLPKCKCTGSSSKMYFSIQELHTKALDLLLPSPTCNKFA